MFLFPVLTIGFLFVAVPLLVHLINMLRHRRQPWAAMDFLLASYRKQRKWVVLRQLLLLLSRLALAALLIALLAGWTGGGKLMQMLGGKTVHHVVLLDDSYSMGDASGNTTAYQSALQTLQDLTRQLAQEDGEHRLTVMRSSRAALATRGGIQRGDTAADLSSQTITGDSRLIRRVMATAASPLRTDMTAAVEMAAQLLENDSADERHVYLLSDFRRRDWSAPERLTQQLRRIDGDAEIRLVDCAGAAAGNLAITELSPQQDVWVAGVPVVIRAKVKNYGSGPVNNVTIGVRMVLYGDDVTTPEPGLPQSGRVESLPAIVIESLQSGEEVTKTFQVFVAQPGTHAIEAWLPEDALAIDNRRICTLPLSETQKVLVIDDDPDGRGAYHVGSVLNPGGQVNIGAVPQVEASSFLRSITPESLAEFRAVYLIDVPTIGEGAAAALDQYVRSGGGLAWFLGESVDRTVYNQTLVSADRRLLPAPLLQIQPLRDRPDGVTADVRMDDSSDLLRPLASAGDGVFSLVRFSDSWLLDLKENDPNDTGITTDVVSGDVAEATTTESENPVMGPVRVPLRRTDGVPVVMQHDYGRGRVVTVAAGLDGQWTNWTGDPTFVVFLLQTNAYLWSAASPPTARSVDDPMRVSLPADRYAPVLTWLPANEPPRLPIELSRDDLADDDSTDAGSGAASGDGDGQQTLELDPVGAIVDGRVDVTDLMRPGLGEWMLTALDGQTEMRPVATTIRVGESDLQRSKHAEVLRDLQPVDAEFIDRGRWNDQTRQAGSSLVSLVLLGLLALVFAIEQALAYWASYHAAAPSSIKSGRRGGGVGSAAPSWSDRSTTGSEATGDLTGDRVG
ncbi:BatA domain-containing protein [Crateriforma conspicua]|uniref:Aerotolerance regulator N-terminal domain-containing protein n=1 Tax=Crateriforma conspicua TaxID=2527996 RepID=A0A5C5Y1G2_9PLAN|nr:BatA domain-containing protein [Crateriforma conspicua]TWT68980.1 hypothetical protein Pan14r_12640 [Crateriforma conspicua]